jgi:hypothetical protein
MALFLVVQSEADVHWINLDNVKEIQAKSTSPDLTTVSFVDGTRRNFSSRSNSFSAANGSTGDQRTMGSVGAVRVGCPQPETSNRGRA